MLTGPDCSRHQGVVDWPAVRRAGHSFAFIKATDGVAYRHIDWFHTNLPKVRTAGLVPGAYHFLVDHHPGVAQARYYVTEVNRAGGFAGVVPIVDIEREADGTTPRESHLRDFVAEFRRLVPGRRILVYTGRWYWVGVLGNPHGADLGPLWHSEYDGISPIDFDVANGPELERYGGWPDCLVWQHTSSGSCPGIAGRCDLNLFYGDHAALAFNGGAAVAASPAPVPEEPDMLIIDCPGKPAIAIGVGGVKQLNPTQRSALRAVGVEAKLVAPDVSDAVWSLREPVTEFDVDEDAIAAAVVAALPDGLADGVTVANIVAGVRGVFADAGTAEG